MSLVIEILLRLPFLFSIDIFVFTCLWTKDINQYDLMKNQLKSLFSNKTSYLLNLNATQEVELQNVDSSYFDFISFIFVMITLFTLFMSPFEIIKKIYYALGSFTCFLISKFLNDLFIEVYKQLLPSKLILISLLNYFAQIILGKLLIFTSSLTLKNSDKNDLSYIKDKFICLLLTVPTITNVLFHPSTEISNNISLTVFSITSIFVIISFAKLLLLLMKSIKENISWGENTIRYNGILHLIEVQWTHLKISQIMKIFWITKLLYQSSIILYYFFLNYSFFDNQVTLNSELNKKNFIFFAIKLLSNSGCETIICVLGMSTILCSISKKIGRLIQKFLAITDEDADFDLGKVFAVFFFLLALQTELTKISADLRFIQLFKNLFLLITANLLIIHSIVNPLLLKLSASRNRSWNKHARSLFVCLLLIVCPIWFLFILWRNNSLSTWLLVVSTLCIEIVIKVNSSILIYSLYMINAYKTTNWEKLDDYVFYIKSFQNTIQFIFSVLIFCNGAWVVVYETGGKIRCIWIFLHAYLNIYTQAISGWNIFNQRREASYKLSLLKDASIDEINSFDDICAICYQALTSAKITTCNHYFHPNCLKKCLYINDVCPLCLQKMFKNKEKNIKEISETIPSEIQSNEVSESISSDANIINDNTNENNNAVGLIESS